MFDFLMKKDELEPLFRSGVTPGKCFMLKSKLGDPFSLETECFAKILDIRINADGEEWVRYSICLPNGNSGLFGDNRMKSAEFLDIYGPIER